MKGFAPLFAKDLAAVRRDPPRHLRPGQVSPPYSRSHRPGAVSPRSGENNIVSLILGTPSLCNGIQPAAIHIVCGTDAVAGARGADENKEIS
jgi:hypothetical protein